MTKRALPLLEEAKPHSVLQGLCAEHEVSIELLTTLIDIQRDNLGRGRQLGISQEFSAAIGEFLDEQKELSNASD